MVLHLLVGLIGAICVIAVGVFSHGTLPLVFAFVWTPATWLIQLSDVFCPPIGVKCVLGSTSQGAHHLMFALCLLTRSLLLAHGCRLVALTGIWGTPAIKSVHRHGGPVAPVVRSKRLGPHQSWTLGESAVQPRHPSKLPCRGARRSGSCTSHGERVSDARFFHRATSLQCAYSDFQKMT